MPLTAPVVFPLFPIVNGVCGCGRIECGRVGKHPAVAWGELKAGDPVPRPVPGAGAGIKTGARPSGSGVFVVDLDGEAAQAVWCDLADGDDPDTFAVGTGRDGGVQFYFAHPGFHVRNSIGDLGPGIDIRGDGGFVVAPGSPHKSGRTYTVLRDLAPAPAPAWLLEWLRARPAPVQTQSYDGDVSGEERERRREMYAKYLATDAPPRGAARRGRGDATLFEVVQYGAWDLALPVEDVLELVREHYDPRCEPMWGDELEERVHHKAHDAKTKSNRPRQVPLLASEEAILTAIEPTRLAGAEDDNCGFKIRWGGWSAVPKLPRYLVDGLLVESKVSMIYAQPGSIKTWTAIDLACCVATGRPWLGMRSVIKGPVVYMDFEDGQDEFHRRAHMLFGEQKEDAPDLGYMYSPGRMDDEGRWLKLADLQKKKAIKFVVIDTLFGANRGVDENDVNAANMLALAGMFTEATKATVLVIHHMNKAGGIRGTSAFKGAVDAAFKLENIEDDEKKHRAILTCEKSGQKKVPPIRLELTDDGMRTFEPPPKEGEKGEKILTDDEVRAKIKLLLGSYCISSKKKLRELVGAGAARVDAELAELTAMGEVARTKMGFVLDDDKKRTERVIESVRRFDYWASEAELARDAGVPTEFIHELKRRGVVADRASGEDVLGFIVLKG